MTRFLKRVIFIKKYDIRINLEKDGKFSYQYDLEGGKADWLLRVIMKILVVSGFLGAGKTTFIEKMTNKLKRDFVILENEYGEVGIDGDLLKKDYDKIWEMTEGCICCSMKSNFANSVMTIANSLDPEVLIVEPTGVGMLSSVLDNIKKVQYDRIKILEPVTIVDPNCIDKYSKEFEEIFVDQIKSSKFVVVSKTSNMTKEEIKRARDSILKINPKAIVNTEEFSSYDDIWWEEILELKWDDEIDYKDTSALRSNIDNIAFKNISFDELYIFESYMSAIMRGRFGNIIRAKGFLPINGAWAKVDIVGERYTLEKIDAMAESKLVLIGKDLNKEELKLLFNSCK